MERLKNMGLKKSFLLLSLSCLAVAFLLLGAVIFLCRGIENHYPLGGVEILSDGSIVPLPSPTASQQRILAILNIVQTLSCILFPVGGLIVSVFLFYYLKLKWLFPACKMALCGFRIMIWIFRCRFCLTMKWDNYVLPLKKCGVIF